MADVTYAPKVVQRDRNQSEFTKTIWDYLDTAVSDLRVSNGKAALKRQAKALTAIEERYGVPAESRHGDLGIGERLWHFPRQ